MSIMQPSCKRKKKKVVLKFEKDMKLSSFVTQS